MAKLIAEFSKMHPVVKIFIVCWVMGLIFAIYLLFVGIPRTQARNLYNKAMAMADFGSVTSEQRYLQKALTYWPENYIKQQLDRL